MIIATFLVALIIILAIGLSSGLRARGDRRDYYLCSSAVPPWLVGLSAVATNNSGYMFIGVIGFTYMTGLAAIWLMFGWILGDFAGSLFIHRKLREMTERSGEASFPAVLARWSGENLSLWRRLAAIVMIIFLGAYAAAQISAGGKALQGVLGWQPETGAWIGAGMVLAYSIAGGIRASIWTDAAQSAVMLAAMSILFMAGIAGRGGPSDVILQMDSIPHFLDLFPQDLLLPGMTGVGLFILGWVFAGFSVVGQPHIMVRFMALDEPANIGRARVWYYSYFTAFYCLATGVGLLSRLYLPDLATLDPELALPTMAREILPPAMVGLILAGIFSATLSTADSLILSCSAAITHDLASERVQTPWLMKAATAAVTFLALAIALSNSQSVFNLVILAWSALASAFAPLLSLYAMRRRVSQPVAILLMGLGLAIVIAWRSLGWHEQLYEGLPGILIPLVFGILLSKAQHRSSDAVTSAQPADSPST